MYLLTVLPQHASNEPASKATVSKLGIRVVSKIEIIEAIYEKMLIRERRNNLFKRYLFRGSFWMTMRRFERRLRRFFVGFRWQLEEEAKIDVNVYLTGYLCNLSHIIIAISDFS